MIELEDFGHAPFNPRALLEREIDSPAVDIMEAIARDAANDTNYMQALLVMVVITEQEKRVINTQGEIIRQPDANLREQWGAQMAELGAFTSAMHAVIAQTPEINSAYSDIDRRLAGVSIMRRKDGQAVSVFNIVSAIARWGALLRRKEF